MATDILHETDGRSSYVSGLRQLAAFIEAHPDLPLPWAGSHNVYVNSKADLAMFARSAGVRWEKSADDNYFFLKVTFAGNHSYDVNVSRSEVCRKEVIGTHVEPAQPERVVEDYRWVCDDPLLAVQS